MKFVFYAPFHALPGIIINRTKICLYAVKERDVLNVTELSKHSQTRFPWAHEVTECSEKKQPTHIEIKHDSIHRVISDYVLHVHTLSCPNMVLLVVSQKFCFLLHRVCLLNADVQSCVSSLCYCCQCNIESAFFSSFNFKPAGSFMNRISFRRQSAAISTPV